MLTSQSARATIPAFDELFSSRGIPDQLTTDNGTPFQSEEFAEFADTVGFKHRKVAPYWPNANGAQENFMKPLGKACKAAQLQGKPWKREMYKFLRNYRATPHCSTGIAPATLLNGYPMKTTLPQRYVYHEPDGVRQRDNDAKAKQKMYAEARRNIKESNLHVGDKVLMKNVTDHGKLKPKFHEEPYEVIEKRGSMVIAKRGNEVKARNSSHFKKLMTDEEPLVAMPENVELEEEFDHQLADMEERPEPETSQSQDAATQPLNESLQANPGELAIPQSPQAQPAINPPNTTPPDPAHTVPQLVQRPQRNARIPRKYDDFEVTLPKVKR